MQHVHRLAPITRTTRFVRPRPGQEWNKSFDELKELADRAVPFTLRRLAQYQRCKPFAAQRRLRSFLEKTNMQLKKVGTVRESKNGPASSLFVLKAVEAAHAA